MTVNHTAAALAFALCSVAIHAQAPPAVAAPVPTSPAQSRTLATRNGFMDVTSMPVATRTVTPPAGGFMAKTPTPFKVPPVSRTPWASPVAVYPVIVRYPAPVLTNPPVSKKTAKR